MNNTLKIKFLSSLEKCFVEDSIDTKSQLLSISMLKNERYSFCIAYQETDNEIWGKALATAKVTSNLNADISVKKIENVPVIMAAYHNKYDDNYIKRTSGLYPDLLTPYSNLDKESNSDTLYLVPNNLNALWVTIEPNEKTQAGTFEIEASFYAEDGTLRTSEKIELKVIDALLPDQTFTVAQWLYADCLSSYYDVEVLSDEHFRIIENYIKTAVKYGITQILTPVLTPPLDTAEGGERPTVQLVEIVKENNEYSFKFDMLDKWIEMCERCGVKKYEIAHLFTQWGAKHAPKVMATVNGEYKRIFGWETDAFGDEYKQFLRSLLKALVNHLDSKEIEKSRVVFHISDEPSLEHLDNYIKAQEFVSDILADYKIIDALSNYEFYEQGIVKHPIPSNDHMDKFIENKVPDLWTYYCCAQCVDVSNRFISMPSTRNRIIGTQFYKYNITGFLHWAFNFYYNQFSKGLIDPYRITDGEYFSPSGDTFSVYPAKDGTAYESIRLIVFYEALQDLRAMQLCEQLYSREFVMGLIENELEIPITFTQYPHEAEYILSLRNKINSAIEKATL